MQSKINSRSTASTLIEKASRTDLNLARKNCRVSNGALIEQAPCLYPLVHLMGAEGIVVDDGRCRDLIARLQGVEAQQRRVLDAFMVQGIVAPHQRITESRSILDAWDSRGIATADHRRARGRAFGNSWSRELLDERRRSQQAGIVDTSGLEKLNHCRGTKGRGIEQASGFQKRPDIVAAKHRGVDQPGHLRKLDDRMDAHFRDVGDARRVEDKLKQLHFMGAEFVGVDDRRGRQGFLDRATGIECRETSGRRIGQSSPTEVRGELVANVLGLHHGIDGRCQRQIGVVDLAVTRGEIDVPSRGTIVPLAILPHEDPAVYHVHGDHHDVASDIGTLAVQASVVLTGTTGSIPRNSRGLPATKLGIERRGRFTDTDGRDRGPSDKIDGDFPITLFPINNGNRGSGISIIGSNRGTFNDDCRRTGCHVARAVEFVGRDLGSADRGSTKSRSRIDDAGRSQH